VEAAELIERAVLVAEQIAHQMLDASREQATHARGGMERLAQPLGDLFGVTVGAAGQQDQLPVVALGDPLRQFEGSTQLMQWVAASACRLERDLDGVAQFGLHAQHGGERTSAEGTRAEVACALEQPHVLAGIVRNILLPRYHSPHDHDHMASRGAGGTTWLGSPSARQGDGTR
jgi:hypothetical protein